MTVVVTWEAEAAARGGCSRTDVVVEVVAVVACGLSAALARVSVRTAATGADGRLVLQCRHGNKVCDSGSIIQTTFSATRKPASVAVAVPKRKLRYKHRKHKHQKLQSSNVTNINVSYLFTIRCGLCTPQKVDDLRSAINIPQDTKNYGEICYVMKTDQLKPEILRFT